jgi:hypothetical protein
VVKRKKEDYFAVGAPEELDTAILFLKYTLRRLIPHTPPPRRSAPPRPERHPTEGLPQQGHTEEVR